VPEFRDAHLSSSCLDSIYEFQRVVLQLQQWRWRQTHPNQPLPRWVFKCPDHMLALDSLLKVFPDSSFIWTHRDPAEVLPSMTSLAAILQSLGSNKVQAVDVAEPMKVLLMTMYSRAMAFREKLEAQAASNNSLKARFVDVHYLKFIQDPSATLDMIYQQLGITREGSVQEQQTRFVTLNPRHKNGVHRYSAEKLGYTSADFRTDVFETYIARYGVKEERK